MMRLTKVARAELLNLRSAPKPRCEWLLDFAPWPKGTKQSTISRLIRAGLAEVAELPSPYRAQRGGTCPHVRITERGRAALTATMQEATA